MALQKTWKSESEISKNQKFKYSQNLYKKKLIIMTRQKNPIIDKIKINK
uniref:Uncharacterized protein n=1 Tax=viral metagenome TaxID=1070528 RepID=A0A6M3LSR4_9ZZZZ